MSAKKQGMRLLVSVAHPAHVHVFKHVAWKLQRLGWEVLFVARDKEVTIDLLHHCGFAYRVISKQRQGRVALAAEQMSRVARLLPIMMSYRPDVVVSLLDPSVGMAAWLTRKPYVALADTDHAVLTVRLGLPFSTVLLTPECYGPDHGKKQVRYNGYHELAYLHSRYEWPALT